MFNAKTLMENHLFTIFAKVAHLLGSCPVLQRILCCLLKCCSWCWCKVGRAQKFPRKRRCPTTPEAPIGGNRKKPAWIRNAILQMHAELNLSHRKLANLFNQRYFAKTGHSIGRTWVRQLLITEAHRLRHLQKDVKHHIPAAQANNTMWGIDTTTITDTNGQQNIVLGIIDHGSRLNLLLHYVSRFNQWTFLGYLFLAIGQFDRPITIKTDNCAVFHGKWVKRVLHWCRIRRRFSRPARPWENGRIERFFGTLKATLNNYKIRDIQHLSLAMLEFQMWYNKARPHQHLNGLTPQQAWDRINPYQRAPKTITMFTGWEGRLKAMVLRH